MNLLEWQQLGIHFFMFTFTGIAFAALGAYIHSRILGDQTSHLRDINRELLRENRELRPMAHRLNSSYTER